MAPDSSPDFDRGDISPPLSSDDDSMVSKRKELTSNEFEGSGKKKKYSSRESIKEYSASHPESSGLKVADLVTRCSPGRFVNVMKRFTSDQQEAVKSIGFGGLLDLKCTTLCPSLCLWLLERFKTNSCSLEICGQQIPLSVRDVELLMGLPAGGMVVVKPEPEDSLADFCQKYNALDQRISVRFLEERLGEPEAGDDFKRYFCLYVLGTLLCPTEWLDVSPLFLHLLTDTDSIHEYNWANFLLDKLVGAVYRFRYGKQLSVGGCLLFLQLLYYESVAIGGSYEVGPVGIPYLASWTDEKISEREKQEKELGGYGSGEVICKEKGLGLSLSLEKAHMICKEKGLGLSLSLEKAHTEVQPLSVRADRSILAPSEENTAAIFILACGVE